MKQGERADLRGPEDGKSTEDAARDDMFVDCPDELTTFDGRQKEEEVAAAKNEDDGSEENEVMHQQQSHFDKLGNGVGDGYSSGQLEKVVAQKEIILKEYQVCGCIKD